MKINPEKISYYSAAIVVICSFMAANSVKIPYSPYQLLVWELKANEGYRSNWYPDGYVDGRKAYSIGFGWNDLGKRRRNEIAEFTKDGSVSYDEATKITIREIQKYGKLHKDPYKNVALQLYSYNCGPTSNGQRLGKCCGAKWGCGNANRNIRISHGRRRKFEMALWNHDLKTIMQVTESNKEKVAHLIAITR